MGDGAAGATTRGVVWLKAAGPETAFEADLYGLLERVVPDRVLVPIAVDAGRGWMVLPDGGARLGERLDDLDLAPVADPAGPPLGRLHHDARLSRSAVAVADIEYPEPFAATEGEAPSRHGTLIVAKALLTPDMPYELLTYALKETAFPRQSTGDQFFDHAQFDAYRALGFHIGTAALAAGKAAAGRPAAY